MDGLSGNDHFYLVSRNLFLKESRASLLHHLGVTVNFFMPLEKDFYQEKGSEKGQQLPFGQIPNPSQKG